MTEEKKKLDDEKLEDVAGGFWIVPDVDYAAAVKKQPKKHGKTETGKTDLTAEDILDHG